MKEREFVEVGFIGRKDIVIFASDKLEATKRARNRNMIAHNLNGEGYHATTGLREGYRFEGRIVQ